MILPEIQGDLCQVGHVLDINPRFWHCHQELAVPISELIVDDKHIFMWLLAYHIETCDAQVGCAVRDFVDHIFNALEQHINVLDSRNRTRILARVGFVDTKPAVA